MKYFATIYIDTMKPKPDFIPFTIPHAFLGLTHAHPDEKQGNIEIEKYSNPQYDPFTESYFNTIKKDKGKWYERVYPSILDSSFGGEGFFGFGPVTHAANHWGKVYENNQYAPEGNDIINEYVEPYYYKERPLSTFWQQNRCVFEISKEQYEKLLESIKEDVEKTIKRTPILTQDDSKMTSIESLKENLYYNSTPIKSKFSNLTPPLHNCTTWALNKLESIGIEVLSDDKGRKEWIPDAPILDDLKETFMYLRFYNAVFLQFQAIDSNLKSIKGAKAFNKWARMMIDNMYCFALKFDDERNTRALDKRQEFLNAPFEIILWKDNAYRLMQVYRTLREKLGILKSKRVNLKGKFILIYNDKQSGNRKIFIDPSSGYMEQDLKYLDLTIPANNFSVSEFYPFIFVPDDEMIAHILYREYDYATLSANYIKDTMEFYYAFLEGREIKEYWSEAFHAINKRVKDEYRLA